MTCDGARDLFSALVDDGLSPDERRSLDEHLAGCAECRRELEAFQRTIALVRAAPPLRAPAGFVDRVLVAARPTPWYLRLGRRLFVPVRLKVPIEAVAVLVIAVVALQLYRETPELQRAVRQEAPPPTASETLAKEAAPTPPATPPPARDARRQDDKAPEMAKRRQKSDDGARSNERSLGPEERAAARPAEGDFKQLEKSTPAMKDDGQAARERTAAVEPRPPAAQPESERLSEQRVDEQRQAKKEPAPASKVAAPPRSESPVGAARPSPSAPSPVDVTGRLAVADRAAAETALTDLVLRLGGAVIARRADADATVVEVRVPRVAYADLLQGLARIGRWAAERESGELPEQVRLSLRLGG